MSWLAAALTLLANTPEGADSLAPYRDRAVVSVDIQAPPGENIETLRSLIAIEPGYLVSSAALRDALKRLWAIGRFADVQVLAQRTAGTVRLTFVLKAVERVGDIDVQGNDRVDGAELLKRLSLRPGDELDSNTVPRLTRQAHDLLARWGFPNADVRVEAQRHAPGEAVPLTLMVKENEPTRIAAVEIVGRPRAPMQELLAALPVRLGDVLNQDVLDGAPAALRRLYASKGFLEASVAPAELLLEPDLRVRVRINVDAGDRIALLFRGNHALLDAELLQLWPGGLEQFRAADLRAFLQRVERQYGHLGYPDARVRVRMLRDPRAGIRRYLFAVREGAPVRVTDITFVGAEAIPAATLRAQVYAVLERELGKEHTFERLTAYERTTAWHEQATTQPGDRDGATGAIPPARERWAADVYDTALAEITVAYRNRGFLQAQVGPAQLTSGAASAVVLIPVREGAQTHIESVSLRGNNAFSALELLEAIEAFTAHAEGTFAVAPGLPYSDVGAEDARIAIVRKYRDAGYLYAQVQRTVEHARAEHTARVAYTITEGPQVRVQRVLVRGNRHTREGVIRSRMTVGAGDIYKLGQVQADQRSIAALGVFSNVQLRLIDEEQPAELKDLVADVTERNRQLLEVAPGLSTVDGPRFRASYAHLNVLGTASTFGASVKVNRKLFFEVFGSQGDQLRSRYEAFTGLEELSKAFEREVRVGMRSPPVLALPLDPSFRLDLLNERENDVPFSLDRTAAIFGIDMKAADVLRISIEPQVSLTTLTCPPLLTVEASDAPQAPKAGEPASDLDTPMGPKAGEPGRPVDLSAAELATTTCLLAAEQIRGRRITAGDRRTFEVGPSLTLDLRDDPFTPTQGLFANARASYAVGEAGRSGAFTFVRVEGLITAYVPARTAVLAVSARGGAIQALGEVRPPPDERFFLGGRDTLRGFIERAVIPQDACVDVIDETGVAVLLRRPPGVRSLSDCRETIRKPIDGPPITQGGDTYLLLKSELRLPLTASLSLGVFVDMGNLWTNVGRYGDLHLRVGTGAGLRYATPIGPLALDLGVNPDRRVQLGEPLLQGHFSVGVF